MDIFHSIHISVYISGLYSSVAEGSKLLKEATKDASGKAALSFFFVTTNCIAIPPSLVCLFLTHSLWFICFDATSTSPILSVVNAAWPLDTYVCHGCSSMMLCFCTVTCTFPALQVSFPVGRFLRLPCRLLFPRTFSFSFGGSICEEDFGFLVPACYDFRFALWLTPRREVIADYLWYLCVTVCAYKVIYG